jgi:hypothetical protein
MRFEWLLDVFKIDLPVLVIELSTAEKELKQNSNP